MAEPDGVTVRYWAGARQAAGTAQESLPAGSLDDVLAAARSSRGEEFSRVLSICSFLVGEQPVGVRDHADVRLVDGAVLDVLPPFAGG
jgi:sulfur-carrier protein